MVHKRIVICADGTWNDPHDAIPTNVLRVARAVAPYDGNGVPQVVFYDWGVGSYYDPVRGGASGVGLTKNIQDGYRFIVHNYAPGDELFLFGFSRGAYTVRALAGMLNNCGVLRRDVAELIPRAFTLYRQHNAPPQSAVATDWRQHHAHAGSRGEVRFLGAWDTVGALGIPTRALAFVDGQDLFFDTQLGSNVQCARHALAIDEQRSDFAPTLWQANDAQDLKQVWFAGVHGDIGGGTRAQHGLYLSDLALAWMAREARRAGLALEDHLHGPLEDLHTLPPARSHRGFYRVLGRTPRTLPADALIHQSVATRRAHTAYQPAALHDCLEDGEIPAHRIER